MHLNKRRRLQPRRKIKSVLVLFILSLAFFTVLHSCSDSPSTSPDPDPEEEPLPNEELVCDSINVEPQSAEPLSIITINGIDSSFGETPAGILESGENIVPFLLTENEEQGVYEFILPVHPSGNIAGGSSEITIFSTEGTNQCDGFEMDITSINSADGELKALSETIVQGVQLYFLRLGIEPKSILDESPTEVAPHYLPFRTLYHLFDPESEYSLISILEGNSSYAENGDKVDEDTRALIDALLAKSGLNDEIKSFFDQFEEEDAVRTSTEQYPEQYGRDVNKSIETVSIERLSDLMMQTESFAPYGVTSGQGSISDYLDIHLALHKASSSIQSSLLASLASDNPEYAGLASGTMAVIESMLTIVFPDLLPTEITLFELFTDIEEFNEDSEEEGVWNLQIEASSNGIAVDINMLSGGMSDLLDNEAMTDLTQEIATNFEVALQSISTSLIGMPSGDGTITFPPTTWQTTVIADDDGVDEYVNVAIEHISSWNGEPAIGLNEENHYVALREGESDLKVGLKNDLFGLDNDVEESRLIKVNPIEIEISDESGSTAEEFILRLDEEKELKIDLFAEVGNADDPSLAWSSEDGAGGFFTEHDSKANHVTYYPPQEEGLYLVVAESITDTGPRENQDPPRTATAKVRVVMDDGDEDSELFVTSPGCMTPEDEIGFTAFLEEQQIPVENLSWTVEGPGSLSENGIFTPNGLGIVIIDFFYEDPDSGESHTTQTSFVVLESCGELSIESDYFTYSTECVAAQYVLTTDAGDVVSGIWAGPFGTELQLGIETDLSDKGEWERTFTRPAPNEWAIPGFESPDGRQWYHTASVGASPGSFALEIKRTERIVGEGEDVIPVFSGNFEVPMEDTDEDSNITTIFEGEFSGVPYSSPGISKCQ